MPLADPWAPYAPDQKSPWDLRRVVHLHRRAGFAATWGEIRRDLKDGPKASVERLLSGKARSQGVPEDFAATADALADSAGEAGRLKAWWVYRMLFGPDPLTERLALLWHNHFATSNEKVRDVRAMLRQNALFREHGRHGPADVEVAPPQAVGQGPGQPRIDRPFAKKEIADAPGQAAGGGRVVEREA